MTSLFLPKAPRRDFGVADRRESDRRFEDAEAPPAWWVGLVLAMFAAALVFFANPSLGRLG